MNELFSIGKIIFTTFSGFHYSVDLFLKYAFLLFLFRLAPSGCSLWLRPKGSADAYRAWWKIRPRTWRQTGTLLHKSHFPCLYCTLFSSGVRSRQALAFFSLQHWSSLLFAEVEMLRMKTPFDSGNILLFLTVQYHHTFVLYLYYIACFKLIQE